MAGDASTLGLVLGAAALTNTVYSVQHNKDAVPPLVATGVMFGGLTLVGTFTNEWRLPIAFATVFLLATFIARGIPIIQSTTSIVTAKPSTAASSTKGGSTGNGYSGGGGGGGGGSGL